MSMFVNYYELLETNITATEQTIKDRYRQLVHKHHPDKGGDAKQFDMLNRAYNTLKDQRKRNFYNQLLVQYYIENKEPNYILNGNKYIILDPEKTGYGLPDSPLLAGKYKQFHYNDYRIVFSI